MFKRSPSQFFWLVVTALCSAAALFLLWGFEFLPMVDAPQFAGLITILQNYNDDPPHYAVYYALNLQNPYVLPALIGYLIALLLPAFVAFKVLLCLIVFAIPSALLFLLNRLGGPRWLALLGFPLAFGFCFHWGFVSFLAALPPAIVALALMVSWRQGSGKPRDGILLALCGTALLLSHGLMFIVIAALGVAVGLAAHCTRKSLVALTLIALSLSAWAYINLILFPVSQAESLITDWPLVSGGALPEIGFLLGGERNLTLLLLSLALVGAVFLSGLGNWRATLALLPMVILLLHQLLGPERIGFVGYIKERFLILFLVAALLALRETSGGISKKVAQLLVLLVCLSSFVIHRERFAAFNRSVAGFENVLHEIPQHQRLFYVMVNRDALLPGDNLLLHFPGWYQTLKRGHLSFSFTMLNHWPVLARRHSYDWELHRVWYPELFDWNVDSRNDFFLIGADKDPSAQVFKEHASKFELLKQAGRWWLYQLKHRPEGAA